MSTTVTLKPWKFNDLPVLYDFNGSPTTTYTSGSTDPGECIRDANDLEYLIGVTPETPGVTLASYNVWFGFEDDLITIPTSGATINSVRLNVRLSATHGDLSQASIDPNTWGIARYQTDGTFSGFDNTFALSGIGLNSDINTSNADFSSATFTTNPTTAAAWTRAELFLRNDIVYPTNYGGSWFISTGTAVNGELTGEFRIDQVTLTVNFTAASSWYYNPDTDDFEQFGSDPGAPWVLQDPVLQLDAVLPPQGAT
jgi:hypothetical protein